MTPEERAVIEAAVRLDDEQAALARGQWSPATAANKLLDLSDTVSALHAASGGRWKAKEK